MLCNGELFSRPVIIEGRWLYLILASIVRYLIARRWNALPARSDVNGWRTAFAIGVGLAGAGWGAAGIPHTRRPHLPNQVFLVFVLGGMMLGASLLLAPRPEAFLVFLVPTGVGPAIRLFA